MRTTTGYCPNCPRKYQPIAGDGPQPSAFLLIGERPGQTENKYQRVFIGKSGRELDETYLPLAGIERSEVRVTNAVRCWAEGNRTPTDKEIECCAAHHLPEELERTQPALVILLGATAVQLARPKQRLDMHHGIAHYVKLFGWEGYMVPMFHPALGLHESRWMTLMLEDWEKLHDRVAPIEPRVYRTHYSIIRGKEVADVPIGEVVAIDTESHGTKPFSVQISSLPSVAHMVLAEDREGMGILAGRLREVTGIFHHSVYDLNELERLGISIGAFRDTVQEAYHLGNLPQGLKPLVYRLFGVTMTSWEDVVRPYSIEALQVWLVEALNVAHMDLSLIEVTRYKRPYRGQLVKEEIKRGAAEQLIQRLLLHVDTTSEYDPWERLREFWADSANEYEVAHLEARVGKYPILGIGNAPLERAVEYGCGDADWTGQVAAELERRRGDKYWRIYAGDRDEGIAGEAGGAEDGRVRGMQRVVAAAD